MHTTWPDFLYCPSFIDEAQLSFCTAVASIQKSYSLGSRAAKAWADSDGGKVDIAKYSEEPNSDLPLKTVEVATTSAKIKELLSGKDGPANAASLDR